MTEPNRIRPLTAAEWNGLLAELNYTLRVSDGTREGSWYFWMEDDRLHGQRFIWTAPRTVGTPVLADALDGDVTTQVVKRTDELPGDATEDDPGVRCDGGREFQHTDRVRFAEEYPDMPDKIRQLVGDTGFVVNPMGKFIMDGKALVQFDENKTGRPGGERHWIPTTHLEPEGDGDD